MMMQPNRRHLLGLGAVTVVALVMLIAAALGQWVVFAIGGTVLLATLCALSLFAVTALRVLVRRATDAEQRAARLEQSLTRLTDRQQKFQTFVRTDLATEVSEVRRDLQRVETTDTALLDRLSHAERRLVGILESLRLELDSRARGGDHPVADGAAPVSRTET